MLEDFSHIRVAVTFLIAGGGSKPVEYSLDGVEVPEVSVIMPCWFGDIGVLRIAGGAAGREKPSVH